MLARSRAGIKTIRPDALRPGGRVAVVSPSGPVEQSEFENGLKCLAEKYDVVWDQGCLSREGYLAGSDERRLIELQRAIDDPMVNAIFVTRGGYGVSRIIDSLNLSAMVSTPKWIIGSSDISALLLYMWSKLKIESIHGPMMSKFHLQNKSDLAALFCILEGKPWEPPSDLKAVCKGEANGPLVGGNLTVMAHMAGTIDPKIMDGAILFIEDVGEDPYRLDRCLTQLKRSKMLYGIKGAIIGEFTSCEPKSHNIGPLDAVIQSLKPLDIPVVSGYPAAHGDRNYPFVLGRNVLLRVEADSAIATQCRQS